MNKNQRKLELLERMDAGRERLDVCLASLDPQALLRPGVVGNWSVKDILAHLVGWNNALLGWYQAGLDGLLVANPDGKQETDDFNQQIYLKNRERPLEEIRAELDAVHAELRALAESLSPDDLFEPRRFAWTGKWSLSAYLGGCTYHHYSWAQTQIRTWLKRKEKRSAPGDDVQQ